MGRRFRDPLDRISSFLGEVLVVCPRCDGRAAVVPDPQDTDTYRFRAPRRLVCRACGLVATATGPPAIEASRDAAIDPYFGARLWLTADCRGHLLWAFNVDHLDLLENYVGATLRERGEVPGSMSLVDRLPAWIKSAKNREDVLQALGQLRDRAAGGTR